MESRQKGEKKLTLDNNTDSINSAQMNRQAFHILTMLRKWLITIAQMQTRKQNNPMLIEHFDSVSFFSVTSFFWKKNWTYSSKHSLLHVPTGASTIIFFWVAQSKFRLSPLCGWNQFIEFRTVTWSHVSHMMWLWLNRNSISISSASFACDIGICGIFNKDKMSKAWLSALSPCFNRM